MTPFPTSLAAAVADAAGQGIARTAGRLADEIVSLANALRVNAETAAALGRRARAMVAALRDGFPNAELSSAVQSFTSVLERIIATLAAQGGASYLSQLLHQQRDRAVLSALSDEMQRAFDSILLELRLYTGNAMSSILAQNESRLLNSQLPLCADAGGTLAPKKYRVGLPPRPQLFFGRAAETEAAVTAILGTSPARLAILGGPGMGKTTLALSVLHHPEVVERFASKRLFVPCDAAEGTSDCLAIIVEAVGIMESNAKAAMMQLTNTFSTDPTLLVLDNFESAWETSSQRMDAERALQFLDGIETLSIVLTMRGTERPQGLRWTRPSLQPLSPLSDAAAQQTFASIAHAGDTDPVMDSLLTQMDNIPLAVVLLANLAQCEPPETLLARWSAIRTSMLKRGNGNDRLSSVDVSIALSLQSPRMTAVPAASDLLAVLALLPHGVMPADVAIWDLSRSAEALSVLQQTALAVRGKDERIFVLAPVRQFVLARSPPTDSALGRIYQHFFGLTKLTNLANLANCTPELFADVAQELGNVDSVIRYGLARGERGAVEAVTDLCALYNEAQIGPAPHLLQPALATARQNGLEELEADLLLRWAILAQNTMMDGDYHALVIQACEVYERVGRTAGIISCKLRLTQFLEPCDAVAEIARMQELAGTDARQQARCLAALANALQRLGRSTEAVGKYQLAISLIDSGAASLDKELGFFKFRLGGLYQKLGQIRCATQLYEEAISMFDATQLTARRNDACMRLASAYIDQGRPLHAIQAAAPAIVQDGLQPSRCNRLALQYSAVGHAMSGHFDDAMAAIDAINKSRPAAGFAHYELGLILDVRAYVAYCAGDFIEGRELLSAARVTVRCGDPIGNPEMFLDAEGGMLEALGQMLHALGRDDDAAVCACTAAVIGRRLNNNVGLVKSLVLLAETVDSDCAERLLDALMLPLHQMGLSIDLARALSLSAVLAKRRGKDNLAQQRARHALVHFGDVKTDWRLELTARLAQEPCYNLA